MSRGVRLPRPFRQNRRRWLRRLRLVGDAVQECDWWWIKWWNWSRTTMWPSKMKSKRKNGYCMTITFEVCKITNTKYATHNLSSAIGVLLADNQKFTYRICRNKGPPKTVIFQRGEYTKPMGFDGWFFKGGSTQNRWGLMGFGMFFIASKN